LTEQKQNLCSAIFKWNFILRTFPQQISKYIKNSFNWPKF